MKIRMIDYDGCVTPKIDSIRAWKNDNDNNILILKDLQMICPLLAYL